MEEPQGPFCQSCGMPLQKESDFGTNADGSTSHEYCTYCFQNGAFTQPDITKDAMIGKVIGMMVAMNIMPEEQAKALATTFIPTLKRWRR
ncbi:MAG: zinc ribbon domain-containing protein [Methanomicrobia archaeon]|nr:zinc ribbon domain-containing protein [Methanomicrobia archaeon]